MSTASIGDSPAFRSMNGPLSNPLANPPILNPPPPNRISDAITDALPDLAEALFGPFAKALLRIFRPYLPNLLNTVSCRFRLPHSASSSSTPYLPPLAATPTPTRRAAKTFVAMAISHLLSRRMGVGCMGVLLLLWGPSYAEAMAISRGGAMAGLREAAFWELGMAWVGLCCYYASRSGVAVFTMAAIQVICMRDVAMEEGQVYAVNDEPLATKCALWMSLCSMCYFLPRWFAALLVFSVWLLVAISEELATGSSSSAAAADRDPLLLLLRRLASLVSIHKTELLRNTTAGIAATVTISITSSASSHGFLLCLILTFSFFYATMTPERFLANAATLPLLVSAATAAALFVPSLPYMTALLSVAFPAVYAFTEAEQWRHQAQLLRRWRRKGEELWRWSTDGGGAEAALERLLGSVSARGMWSACVAGAGMLAYNVYVVQWDLSGFAFCILVLLFLCL